MRLAEPTVRPAARAALLAAALSAQGLASAAQSSFEFHPAAPTASDTVRIRATYFTSCLSTPGPAEVAGDVIRLASFEGCGACPLAPPLPAEVATTLDPLPAGDYRVELVAAPDPLEAGCDFASVLLGSAELTVTEGSEELVVEPAEPTGADEVTVVLRSTCPVAVEPPSRQGHLLRLTLLPVPLSPPCSPDPVHEARLPFGLLPPGDYTVTLTAGGGFDGTGSLLPYDLVRTHAFRDRPAPLDALTLQGGRFRVQASWTLPGGRSGGAGAVPATAEAGAFFFFGEDNLELTVKALAGCDVNGHYWFFAGGMTHVGVAIEVEDAVTGAVRTYSRPPGSPFAPILDAKAFPCP